MDGSDPRARPSAAGPQARSCRRRVCFHFASVVALLPVEPLHNGDRAVDGPRQGHYSAGVDAFWEIASARRARTGVCGAAWRPCRDLWTGCQGPARTRPACTGGGQPVQAPARLWRARRATRIAPRLARSRLAIKTGANEARAHTAGVRPRAWAWSCAPRLGCRAAVGVFPAEAARTGG